MDNWQMRENEVRMAHTKKSIYPSVREWIQRLPTHLPLGISGNTPHVHSANTLGCLGWHPNHAKHTTCHLCGGWWWWNQTFPLSDSARLGKLSWNVVLMLSPARFLHFKFLKDQRGRDSKDWGQDRKLTFLGNLEQLKVKWQWSQRSPSFLGVEGEGICGGSLTMLPVLNEIWSWESFCMSVWV